MTAPPRRVLVIVTRRIGDVLLATPVIRSLKRAWPGTRIDALVFSSSAAALAANPDVDQIRAIPERPGFSQHVKFIIKLFRRYDLALSLVPGDRPTIYAWLAGRKRVGLLVPIPKESWKQRLLNQWVAYDTLTRHTLLNHLAVLEPLGIAPVAQVTTAWREADEQRAAEALAPLNKSRFVVLHLFPKFNYKMWSDAGWTALARWIDDRGLRIVLTGSNDPAELDFVRKLAVEMRHPLNVAGQLTLNECACVIARATAYVGPDTALTHMAAALGVPTIAIFGPTDPLQWGPWPKGHEASTAPWRRLGDQSLRNVRILQGTGTCVPCHHEGCERHVASYSDCLMSLPASRAINALREIANIQ